MKVYSKLGQGSKGEIWETSGRSKEAEEMGRDLESQEEMGLEGNDRMNFLL